MTSTLSNFNHQPLPIFVRPQGPLCITAQEPKLSWPALSSCWQMKRPLQRRLIMWSASCKIHCFFMYFEMTPSEHMIRGTQSLLALQGSYLVLCYLEASVWKWAPFTSTRYYSPFRTFWPFSALAISVMVALGASSLPKFTAIIGKAVTKALLDTVVLSHIAEGTVGIYHVTKPHLDPLHFFGKQWKCWIEDSCSKLLKPQSLPNTEAEMILEVSILFNTEGRYRN